MHNSFILQQYMLHYDPQHVPSSTLLILRRTNFITTASGIVTLCRQPYSMQVESGLQSALNLHNVRCTAQPTLNIYTRFIPSQLMTNTSGCCYSL